MTRPQGFSSNVDGTTPATGKETIMTETITHVTMAEYRQQLIGCGVTVGENIRFYRIGRSVYSEFAYINSNGDWSLALKPVYRTDWITATDCGPYPALLPYAYRRAPNRSVF